MFFMRIAEIVNDKREEKNELEIFCFNNMQHFAV